MCYALCVIVAPEPAARRKSMDREANGGSATPPSGPRKSMSVWDDNGYVLNSAPSGSMGMGGGMMGGGMMGECRGT